MNHSASDIRRARTAYVWAGVIAPVILLVAALAVLASWMPVLPDPIASHWGPGGADAFAPRWTVLLLPVLGLVIAGAMAATVLITTRRTAARGWPATSRFLGAMAPGMSGMLAVLAVAIAGAQRGLDDASDVQDVTAWVLLALGIGVVIGLVAWFAQPSVAAVPAAQHPIVAVPLGANERAVWFGTVSTALPARIVIGVVTGVIVITALVTLAMGQAVGWMLLGVAAFMLFLLAITLVFRVTVSEAGLRVRSLVGWPDTRIPLEFVAAVTVVPLDPFAEFGGWGWRHSLDGRRGVVLRRGDALQITGSDGRVFVVTVDGADEAAAVLLALKDRKAAGAPAADGEGS
ncbi:DUF1648 domain-containing protein [Microbacterium sp. YJN-G]|uniref:DUF1648 domain-containing protein n=1 Tax=Microbacterium sp. YJN-G TaxID=2763257 RepID=UPI0018788AE7|nr:DUF1648 domain-containing protein [Microbacterium sp. YJN-G]